MHITYSPPNQAPICSSATLTRRIAVCLALLFGLAAVSAQSQTDPHYKILYSFTGGQDGGFPQSGLTLDAEGNLYGISAAEPTHANECALGQASSVGCGTVFRLKRQGSAWVFETLYRFGAGSDGWVPFFYGYNWLGAAAPLTIGPDGSVYGTTFAGGDKDCQCGITFRLTRDGEGWTETVLHRFTWAAAHPNAGALVLDGAGDLYGATYYGGQGGGVVYKLSHSSDEWTLKAIYDSTGTCASNNSGGVVMDSAGNLFGTALNAVYEVTPTASGWTGRILHCFSGPDGFGIYAGLVLDANGNVYGAASADTLAGGGNVFRLSRSGGTWSFSILHDWLAYPGDFGLGPLWRLSTDEQGNVYGTFASEHSFGYNAGVFELIAAQDGGQNGQWAYREIETLVPELPSGLSLDGRHNLYGTLEFGGDYQAGAVFEVTNLH